MKLHIKLSSNPNFSFVYCDLRSTTSVAYLLNKLSWHTHSGMIETPDTTHSPLQIHLCLLQIKVPSAILSSGVQTRNRTPHKYVYVQCRTNKYAHSFNPRTIHVGNSLQFNSIQFNFLFKVDTFGM